MKNILVYWFKHDMMVIFQRKLTSSMERITSSATRLTSRRCITPSPRVRLSAP